MRTRWMAAVALAGTFVSLAGASPADWTAPASRKAVAADFTLADATGAAVKLSDYKGKVVLLDFWATWCEGCKTEIPWYMEFQKKYKAKGLAVIGVAMDDEGWPVVKPFVERLNVNYPVVVGNWDLARQFGIKALPVTLLIDRDGKVADLHDRGLVDRAAFEKEIRTLIRARAGKRD